MQTSVVNYRDLNFELRIDAEYYRAEVLENINLLDRKDNGILSDLASFVIGPFGSTVTVDQYVPSSSFKYVRNKDINDFQISDDDPAYIPEQVYKGLPQFHIRENDLLITVVGTLGKAAIATKKDAFSIFSCKSTIIRAEKIDPFYLLAYLNSSVGQLFALRGARGAIQQGLNLSDLKEIKVFLPSDVFRKSVRSIVVKAFVIIEDAKNLYSQAEQILLSELGLLNWMPEYHLSFVRNFSDTKSADRIDAEYFQPMYDEVVEKVKQYKNGWSRLDDQFSQNRKSFHKINDHNYHYVEISCVRTSDGSIEPLVLSGRDLPANAKIKLQKNDIIISKVRPYRGAISIIQTDNLVGSSAFTVVQEKGTLFKETLFVLLRTKAYLKYSLKFNTGTSYPTIDDQDILGFPVPLIANAVQVSIKHKIEEAIRTKHQSQSLLDIAKRGVELAIEENEQSAEKWIKRELDKLDVET